MNSTKLMIFAVVIALLGPFASVTPARAQSDENGITKPLSGATISDITPIQGIADDPAFLKWQLDLLPEGKAEQANFLALGRSSRPTVATFTSLDTTLYPDGEYVLRLRVVREDTNYNEYFTAVTIDNSNTAPREESQLTAPEDNEVISGRTQVRGIVNRTDLRAWELRIEPAEQPKLVDRLVRRGTPAPREGVLFTLDTLPYANGDYVLRLRIIHTNQNFVEISRTVGISNVAVIEKAPVGINAPVSGTVASGALRVQGAAYDPAFSKWQLDLLLFGQESQATFVVLGQRPLEQTSTLVNLDTTKYPNGKHVLRLRVVRQDTNYDEYFVPVEFNN